MYPVLHPRTLHKVTLHYYYTITPGYTVPLRTIRYYSVFPCATESYTKHPVSQDITQSYPTLLYYPRFHYAYTGSLSVTSIGYYVLIGITQSYSVFLYVTKCSTVLLYYPSPKVTLRYTAILRVTMCYYEYTTTCYYYPHPDNSTNRCRVTDPV